MDRVTFGKSCGELAVVRASEGRRTMRAGLSGLGGRRRLGDGGGISGGGWAEMLIPLGSGFSPRMEEAVKALLTGAPVLCSAADIEAFERADVVTLETLRALSDDDYKEIGIRIRARVKTAVGGGSALPPAEQQRGRSAEQQTASGSGQQSLHAFAVHPAIAAAQSASQSAARATAVGVWGFEGLGVWPDWLP